VCSSVLVHRRGRWILIAEVGVLGDVASALLSAGVSIKAVQSHLGHGSAALTLDVYGHLMPSDDDRSRTAIGDSLQSAEDSLRTGAGG
jgi:integrase